MKKISSPNLGWDIVLKDNDIYSFSIYYFPFKLCEKEETVPYTG